MITWIGLLTRLLALTLAIVGWILSIFLSIWLIHGYGDLKARDVMQDVNGLTFGARENPMIAHVTIPPIANEEGYSDETEQMTLMIHDAQGKVLFEKGLLINNDLFGTGFLKAMQVDEDPDLEVVFCVTGFQNSDRAFSEEYFASHNPVSQSFYLDFNSGQITLHDLMSTPTEVRDRAQSRLMTQNPLFYVMFEIMLSPVFVMLGYRLLMRLFNPCLPKRPVPIKPD